MLAPGWATATGEFRAWTTEVLDGSPSTATTHTFAVRKFAAWVSVRDPDAASPETITRRHIKEYVRARLAAGKSSATVRCDHAALSSFWRFLKDQYDVEASPPTGVILPRKRLNRRPAITWEQLKAVLREVQLPVHRAMILTMAIAALRRSEVMKLDLLDFDRGQRLLTLRGTKGRKDRLVPVHKALFGPLCDYVDNYREASTDPALFLSRDGKRYSQGACISHGMLRAVKRAGLAGIVTPRELRKLCATELAKAGAGVFALRDFLGHLDIRTTQIYVEIGEEAVRRAAEKLVVPAL